MMSEVGIKQGLAAPVSRLALRVACLSTMFVCATLPSPASAQFNFFQLGEPSTQDIYDTIVDHGFRPAGPLMRNGNVYVADVIDRGLRRERLVISARNAQIIQRFFVDVSGPSRRSPYAGETFASRSVRPDEGGGFFSRLTRGWNDDAPPRPPVGIDNGQPEEAVAPRSQTKRAARPKSTDLEPRLATRRDDAPITTAPLPAVAPTASPVQTTVSPTLSRPAAVGPAPQPASTPSPNAPAATSTRPTVVVTDPLRIPGDKPRDVKPSSETAAVIPAAKSAPIVKPALKPTSVDVPVAPLD